MFRKVWLTLSLLFTLAIVGMATSQIDIIQFLDSTGAIVKSFAAPFKIKEGTGVNFTASGSTLTLTNSSPGVTDHSALSNLDYASAGHTGFTPSTRTISTTAPLSGGGNFTADRTLSIAKASAGVAGYLDGTDWSTFNGKQDVLGFTPVPDTRSVSTTSPLTGGGNLSADRTFAIPKATAAVDGYLDKDDWTAFNNKQSALTTGNLTATAPLQFDQTRQVIGGAASISMAADYMPRQRFTASTTYYVRTDGNDNNDCLTNTAGGACLTIQHAVDLIADVDLSGYNVSIQIADGTYAGFTMKAPLGMTGSNLYIIQGNSGDHNAVIVSASSGHAVECSGNPRIMYLKNVKIQATSGIGIYLYKGGNLSLSGVNFGACASSGHMRISQQSYLEITSNYTIYGDAPRHMRVETFSYLNNYGAYTTTLDGARAFSITFIQVENLGVAAFGGGMSYSGSATGVRYSVTTNSVCNTSGGGANFFPGDSAGSTATGGQYL